MHYIFKHRPQIYDTYQFEVVQKSWHDPSNLHFLTKQNPKPQTPNPKPHTPNPKPQTPNPCFVFNIAYHIFYKNGSWNRC